MYDLLTMTEAYRQKPSELLAIEDQYAAFCFDEACLYIRSRMQAGEQPQHKTKVASMKEFYARIGGDG